jgi:hypothetical protein
MMAEIKKAYIALKTFAKDNSIYLGDFCFGYRFKRALSTVRAQYRY